MWGVVEILEFWVFGGSQNILNLRVDKVEVEKKSKKVER